MIRSPSVPSSRRICGQGSDFISGTRSFGRKDTSPGMLEPVSSWLRLERALTFRRKPWHSRWEYLPVTDDREKINQMTKSTIY